ncbi:MAG: hypothetical protein ACXWL2_03640 [Candidatus Chromulinivorax sp.]
MIIFSTQQKNFARFLSFLVCHCIVQASTFELTNNSTQNINNLIFYNNSDVALTTPTSLLPSHLIVIPSNATYTVSQVFGSTITENVSDSASSDFFGAGFVTNQTGTTLYLNFYNEGNLINSPSIMLPNAGNLPIFTTTTNVNAYSSNMTLVAMFTMTPDYNYSITYTNGIYNLSITSTTQYTLTNNYNQMLTNLTFYDESNTQISNPITLNSNSFINIPDSSETVAGNVFGAIITEAIPALSSFNFYAQGTFTNNTSNTIFINFYNSSNLVINSAPISVPAYVTMPIFTGSTIISAMTSLNPLVYAVPGSQINADNSYTLIQENSDTYEIIEN